jgi:hypothetical protein
MGDVPTYSGNSLLGDSKAMTHVREVIALIYNGLQVLSYASRRGGNRLAICLSETSDSVSNFLINNFKYRSS